MQEEKTKSTVVAVIMVAIIAVGGLGAWALLGNKDPEPEPTQTSQTDSMNEQEPMQNIVEVASADEQFSTLVTAIQTAGLVDTLSGDGPFTVFAPTNAAFEKLPAGTLEDLLSKPEELKKVLTYHVVSGEVYAKDVVKLTEATTVNGKVAPVTVDGDTVKVGNATVTKTDIKTSNGVIHVIDTVLIP